MSWIVGALQGLAGLSDVANTVSGIAYQHRQLDLLRQQNELQAQWMVKNEALQREAMAMTRDLAVNAPAQRMRAALDAGFNSVDARRLAGSSERVIRGYIERPVMLRTNLEGIRQTNNLLTMNSALETFKKGTPFGMSAPPRVQQGPIGFSNPNYGKISLGPRPPESSI